MEVWTLSNKEWFTFSVFLRNNSLLFGTKIMNKKSFTLNKSISLILLFSNGRYEILIEWQKVIKKLFLI